jgi:hypothetical protein
MEYLILIPLLIVAGIGWEIRNAARRRKESAVNRARYRRRVAHDKAWLFVFGRRKHKRLKFDPPPPSDS